jgi:hypothetical protein
MAVSPRDVESHGWTVETLHVYLQQQIDALREQLDLRATMEVRRLDGALAADDRRTTERITALEMDLRASIAAVAATAKQDAVAQKEAVTKAEVANERRFEGVNEFRAQLADQAGSFISRKESDATQLRNEAGLAALKETLADVKDRITRSEGRGAGLNAGWLIAVAAIGIIGTIAGIVGVVVALSTPTPPVVIDRPARTMATPP